MKVPLSEQVEGLILIRNWLGEQFTFEPPPDVLDAAITTLKLMARFETEVRSTIALCLSRDEHFPGGTVTAKSGEVENG